MSVLRIIEAARDAYPGSLQNKKIRLGTVGRLADMGFPIERDGRPPHLSVRFPVSPTDADLEVLTDAFDPAMANPLAAGIS